MHLRSAKVAALEPTKAFPASRVMSHRSSTPSDIQLGVGRSSTFSPSRIRRFTKFQDSFKIASFSAFSIAQNERQHQG
jgi:hypothetical protein